MAVTKEFIVTLAKEFGNIPEDRITALAQIMSLRVNAAAWKDKTDYATALLVMHVLKLEKQAGQGPLTSDTQDKISQTFRPATSPNPDGFDLTVYGSEFKTLAKSILRGPLIT